VLFPIAKTIAFATDFTIWFSAGCVLNLCSFCRRRLRSICRLFAIDIISISAADTFWFFSAYFLITAARIRTAAWRRTIYNLT